MSFASEPGRDDGSLPPVNIVIPDDARELDRDVLAYRREQRALRRRERLARLTRPLNRVSGHVALLPLIAACMALSLIGGVLLSVVTISPASAPTLGSAPPRTPLPGPLTTLPEGTVHLSGRWVPVRALVSSVIALVPAGCGCDPALRRLADQAVKARVGLVFAATAEAIPQLTALTARDGEGAAVPAEDPADVLAGAYHPVGLTVLLVFSDATAVALRTLPADFQLAGALGELTLAGRNAVVVSAGQPAPGVTSPGDLVSVH